MPTTTHLHLVRTTPHRSLFPCFPQNPQLDLATLLVKHVRDSYGGAAWCLAACRRHAMLAVGCEDGAARLFTYDGGALEYQKSLPSTGARVLCCAFHPAKVHTSHLTICLARTLTSPTCVPIPPCLPQPLLFLGCDDGTIRCLDEGSGRPLFRMIGDVLRGVSTYILR